MKNLNEKYAEIVRARFAENLASGNAAQNYMENSTAVYRGEPVACLYMPKIFSRAAWEFLQTAARDICGILDKVIARYMADAAYRALFGFDAALDALIRADAGYSRLLPIARLDIFFDENDFSFKFCEFNADGASAMNENRELDIAHRNSDVFLQMQRKYKIHACELFDTWVHEFLEIYDGYTRKTAHTPRVIIADFMDLATPNEFIEFKKAFIKAGIDTDICDIREFSYTDGTLKTPDGKAVDAIYRRAVTRDIMERKSEAVPFIQAVRDGNVCIIGHFRTQIIHNKAIFRILRLPETAAFLTDSEREYIRRHIPETLMLKTGDFNLKEVLANKDEWVIKPEDFYGSQGVYAGVDLTDDEWRGAVMKSMDSDYLLQRFCPPFKSFNLNFNSGTTPVFEEFNNITGMFMYNGRLAGLYSRGGQYGTISSHHRGMTMSSFVAEAK